MLGLTEVSNAT